MKKHEPPLLLVASSFVKDKINSEHGVTFIEAEEAFNNFRGRFLVDSRSRNQANRITVWGLSRTCEGRLLKLVIIPDTDKDISILRTAYEPDKHEVDL